MHVLGLPPAFTLSQDQTLHLKLHDSEESKVLSAKLVPGTNYSLAFLHLNLCCSVTNVCILWTLRPPARRPHKLPAHTVKDLRNWPQRRFPLPLPRRTEVPEGADYYTANFDSVNTVSRSFFASPSSVQAVQLAIPSAGPRILQQLSNPSTGVRPPRLLRVPP